MKLSETTQNILKNYSTINQSIFLKKGTRLSTISVMRNILAATDVSETFPVDFCIYDLGKFLNLLKIYPELDFQEKYVMMSNGEKTYKFMAAEPSIIVFAENTFKMDNSKNNPKGSKDAPSWDINVKLPTKTLNEAIQVASISGLPDFALTSRGDGVVYFGTLDKKDDTSNISEEPVGESDETFTMYFRTENLKLIEGDYDVGISKNKISTFCHQKLPIQYWITLEQDSTYGA
jgi:hypothetical protein|tara:strand:+ start:66 stop:764 length:699 start_codon:yes stop_codon:yes gene_type:complete